jgi:hypothetical protein
LKTDILPLYYVLLSVERAKKEPKKRGGVQQKLIGYWITRFASVPPRRREERRRRIKYKVLR